MLYTAFARVSRPWWLSSADMRAKVVRGGLQKGGGFPINFCIFERGWLKQNSVKVPYMGGGLQERIRYSYAISCGYV